MTKNIIITGSGGILGTALLKLLSKDDQYNVFAITSKAEQLREEYKSMENIHVYSSILQIPNDLEYVAINCAFPRVSQGRELATAYDYTEELINQLSNYSIMYFVNISSQSVYAQSGTEIQTEESQVEPGSLYGMTKYAIEHLVKLACKNTEMKYTNIRLGSLASSTFDQRMINRFYQKMVDQEDITVDLGDPKVSYLYIDDAAEGLVQLIERIYKQRKVSNVYNLASNDWMTIFDLVEACVNYGQKSGLNHIEVTFSEKESEYNNVINSDLFYKDVDWSPRYSMIDIIQKIFDEKLMDTH